tara:strand:- start:4419 stop:4835 length:417 start_codon:yes stop_codon:yes gene_type:complete
MIKNLFSVSIILCTFFFVGNVLAQEKEIDEDLCMQVRKSHAKLIDNAESRSTESEIRLENAHVDCEAKTVIYVKKITIEIVTISKLVLENLQKQHFTNNCEKGLPTIDFTVVDLLYNKNDLVSILVTKPSDCERLDKL